MKTTDSLSFVQSLASTILPTDWFAKMQSESKCWVYECDACGHERSVWDMGGIRWAGQPARKLAACTNCKNVGFANVSRKPCCDAKLVGEVEGNAG